MQAVELAPMELEKDVGTLALMTVFRFQQLYPGLTPEIPGQLRKSTRDEMESIAHEYAQLIVASGLVSVKAGVQTTPKRNK